MSIPLLFWEPHVFPQEIQVELRRRAINRNFNPTDNSDVSWEHNNSDLGDWNSYRGPMTAWVRVCSNGYGPEGLAVPMPGFVFYGGKDFYTSYGFNDGIHYKDPQSNTTITISPETNDTIIGYTPRGAPHVIANDIANSKYPVYVPNPEIERISATIQKQILRQARIEWTCFSLKQLEYMTPYFLVPGITVIVEWGWNHFNPMSLLDLTDETNLAKLYNNPYPLYVNNILDSKGNYEVVFGIVTNFEWSIDGNKIKCVTEITSKDRLWAGQMITSNMIETDDAAINGMPGGEETKKISDVKVIDSLKTFVINYIDQFRELIDLDKSADDILAKYTGNVSTEVKTGKPEGVGARSPTDIVNAPGWGWKGFENLYQIPNNEAPLNMVGAGNNTLADIIRYVKEMHPDNYKEYLFGLFLGRDESTRKQFSGKTEIPDTHMNKDFDFDANNNHGNFWINMGLVVEIINFFSSQLKGVDDKALFRVDVDDCVIGAHPNLISTNGDILLIPNQLAPKYFSGYYGRPSTVSETGQYGQLSSVLKVSPLFPNAPAVIQRMIPPRVSLKSDEEIQADAAKEISKLNESEYDSKLRPCTHEYTPPKRSDLKADDTTVSLKWANYRLHKIIDPLGSSVRRDDISGIINYNRRHFSKVAGDYEFPFVGDYLVEEGGEVRTYEAFYTGLFKNLYIRADELIKILKDSSVVKFEDVYREIFRSINSAASEFWDFKLVGSTGRYNTTGLATMKVVDYRMTQYTSNNVADIFTFDYYASDGLLQTISFRPMLSNAQAIRTIYAQTNVAKNKQVALSGNNQLLDYTFKDRLALKADNSSNKNDARMFGDSSFKNSMATLQGINPIDKCFQVTSKKADGTDIIYRLAIPPSHSDVLGLLLDDNDETHNPRYTGIMPGIQAEFTLQGIAGIRTFAMFRVRGLPEPYSEDNVVFRVVDCKDTIQNGQWITTIVAGLIPLRGYFRSRLGLPAKVVKRE